MEATLRTKSGPSLAQRRQCGRVEWLRYGSRLDRPDALIGRLRRRRFIVRAEDSREIDPWLERVHVRSAARGE